MSWSRIARRIRVPLGFLFAALFLLLARPSWLSLAMGGVVATGGVWLRAAASGHVRKNAELTTTGPYAYTRNPLYLGSVLIACGFAVASRSWIVFLICLALFLAIYLPVIRSEEQFLRSQFVGFSEYCERVPRLIPRLRPAPGASPGSFSRALYLQHREYNAALGTAAMLGALVAKLLWLQR
ncbi:MAG TPA: isoprenylcysteine carboxylmethyltransferase family protein [Terriglobales bacterium]|nr:isoprenylcysteine carboxylmethyltransferase family protein [Terriglobales bacterium]